MKVASKNLLTKPEGQDFDRKAAEYDRRGIANVLVSFANADGGTVAIGIKDRQFEGIDHLSDHKINDFLQIGFDLIHPALKVQHEFQQVTVNGKNNRILLLTVKSSDEYVFSNSKNEVYLRLGDESKKLTYEQIESLNFSKDIRSYEQETVESALLEDLDEDLLNQYKKLTHFDGKNIWKLLFSRGFANREIISKNSYVYKLNVAGVLMFAKKPNTFIPGARVRFIRYGGTQAGVGENLDVIKESMIEGPLPKIIEVADKTVKSQLREFTSLNVETGKFETVPEYPEGTWLEGIVNAVTHRSYNLSGDDIRIIMYDDRIIIHSPGNLPSIVTVANIRTTHYSRNPNIARGLAQFGWVREFGEGVDRMYKNMEKYFLDDPEYVVTNAYTELTLRNNIVMRNSRRKEEISKLINYDLTRLTYPERVALIYAYEHKKLKPKEFINSNPKLHSSTARQALGNLTKMNLLVRHSSAPTSPNTYYTLKSN
jgi:ATP-dependent DNA helicase RecG